MKHAQEFLEHREQVRVTLVLRGRQKGHSKSSLEFLQKLHEEFFDGRGSLTKPPTETNLSLTYNPKSKN